MGGGIAVCLASVLKLQIKILHTLAFTCIENGQQSNKCHYFFELFLPSHKFRNLFYIIKSQSELLEL